MSEEKTPLLVLTFARRGEEVAVRRAVALAQEAGGRAIAVGTAVSVPVLRKAGVDDVIAYGNGRGARRVVRELRARRVREAAVVYWGPGHGGHLKLELLALASGARVIHRLVMEASDDRVGRGAIMRSVVWKTMRAMLVVAAGAVICGLALACLRLSQLLGGRGASRA